MDQDTKKDLVVAGAAIAGIAATLSPLALAVSGVLVASAWNSVARSAQRRALRLVQHMVAGHDAPETFAEQLRVRVECEEPDDEVLVGFRALLMSAVQAVTPDALPAMGFIGRRLFCGECALHDARAALRVLDVVDVLDLRNLCGLLAELAPLGADVLVLGEFPPADENDNRSWQALPRRGRGTVERVPITPFSRSTHLFTTMKRAGAGTETSAYGIGGSRRAVELERPIIVLLHDALSFPAG